MVSRIIILFFIALLVAAPARADEEISLDQAYKIVGDERIPFDSKQSNAAHEEARYMDHLFFVTDMAMRIRVQTLGEFYKGNTRAIAQYNAEIDDLLSSFSIAPPPASLKEVQEQIAAALNSQKMFFNAWAETAGTQKFEIIMRSVNNDPLVLDAHDHLIQAYNELMQLYPGESEHNKKAFYAHLCSLDFI